MKNKFLFILFFILGFGFISAVAITDDLHLNIQTTDTSGNIVTGTFDFVFNISDTSNCSNIIYTNSTSLTTDLRGIISYYLPNVSLDYDQQYWLCYYRGGQLISNSKIARTPYAFRGRNITLSGVEVDANFNLTDYNVTNVNYGFFDYLGSLANKITKLFVIDINVSNNVDVGGNLTVSERVGIGTISPDAKLEVAGSGHKIILTDSGDSYNERAKLSHTDGSGGFFSLYNDSNSQTAVIRSYASSGVQAYFTAGNVGIGTTTPNTLLEVAGINAAGPITASSWSGTDAHTGTIIFEKSSSTTKGTYTATSDGESLGTLEFYGSDSDNTKSVLAAEIRVYQDGAAGSARVPARMSFKTGTGTATATDRMTILSGGNVGIGTTSPQANLEVADAIHVTASGDSYNIRVQIQNSIGNGGYINLHDDEEQNTVKIRSYAVDGIQAFFNGGGNVGIGTTSPGYKLEVNGSLYAQSYSNLPSISTSDGWLNTSTIIYLNNNSWNVGIGTTSPDDPLDVEGTGIIRITGVGNTWRFMSHAPDGKLYFRDEDNTKMAMTIENNTGNVGIGTTAPDYKLEITSTADGKTLYLNQTVDSHNYMYINRYRALRDGLIIFKTNGTDEFYVGQSNEDDKFVIQPDGSYGTGGGLWMDNAGNVGIGTTSPNASASGTTLHLVTEGDTWPFLKLERINGVTKTNRSWETFISSDGSYLIRDTGGPTDPFVIQPGASTNSFVINSTGNVGIGTSSPTYPLEVNGSILIDTTSSGDGIFFELSSAAKGSVSTSALGLRVDSASGENLIFSEAGSEKMRIEATTGNVGIGTASPGKTLVVNASSSDNGLLVMAPGTTEVRLNDTSGNNQWTIMAGIQNHNDFGIHEGGGAAAYRFYIQNTTGNVGIGTTEPGTALHISGTAAGAGVTTTVTNTAVDGTSYFRMTGDSGLSTGIFRGGSTYASYGGALSLNIYQGNNAPIAFITSNSATPQMVLTGAGNVGIGTISPDAQFHLKGTRPTVVFEETGVTANNTKWDINANGEKFMFRVNNDAYDSHINWLEVERTANTIDTISFPRGNVGIGTTSPSVKLELADTNTNTGLTIATYDTTDAFNSYLRFIKSNSDTIGTEVATANNENLGTIEVSGYDTNNVRAVAAMMQFFQDGNGGADEIPGRIVFSTATDAAAVTERMRITSAGNVGIGTTSPQHYLHIDAGDSGNADASLIFTDKRNYNWTIGVDNWEAAAADKFKISQSTVHGTNDYLTIDTSGNVGIGTTSPGDLYSYSRLAVGAGSSHEAITVYSGGASYGWLLFANGTNAVDEIRGQVRYNHDTDTMDLMTNATARITMGATGNVGIGTSSPDFDLHLENTVGDSVIAVHDTVGQARISVGYDDANDFDIFRNSDNADIYLNATQGTGKIRFQDAGVDTLTIDSAGNVGIGTTSPDAKLHVAATTGVVDGYITSGDSSGTSLWLANNYPSSPNYGGMGLVEADNSLRFSTTGSFSNAGITLLSGGNVGINTTSPQTIFHINATSPQFRLQTKGSNDPLIGFYNSSGNYKGGMWYDIDDDHLELNAGTGSGGSNQLVIQSDGNVGIGTASPDVLLELEEAFNHTTNDYTQFNILLSNPIDVTSGTSYGGVRTLVRYGGGNYYAFWRHYVDGATTADNKFGIGFFTGGAYTDRLTALENGNVGINTTTPQNTLNVIGDINATGSIYKNGNTSVDYVFEDDYEMLSLDELKDFIAENKHLPNLNAEKYTGEYEIGEMDVLLLEKIEELYLYTLELKSQSDLLKQELCKKDKTYSWC